MLNVKSLKDILDEQNRNYVEQDPTQNIPVENEPSLFDRISSQYQNQINQGNIDVLPPTAASVVPPAAPQVTPTAEEIIAAEPAQPEVPVQSEAERLQELLRKSRQQRALTEGFADISEGVKRASTAYAGAGLTQLKPDVGMEDKMRKGAERDFQEDIQEFESARKLKQESDIAEAKKRMENPESEESVKMRDFFGKTIGITIPNTASAAMLQDKFGELANLALNDRRMEADRIKDSKIDKEKIEEAKLTDGQRTFDREFAKDYNEWTDGGETTALNEIDKLKSVANQLRGGKVTTGMFTGLLGDRLTSNKLLGARSDVQSSIMNSLRPILGAQFTEKEGERVIKNTWNEADSTANNLSRIDRLISNLEARAAGKNRKSAEFAKYGTLSNYIDKVQYEELAKEDSDEQAPGKTIVRKQFSPSANQTRITYSDDSTEVVDGKK